MPKVPTRWLPLLLVTLVLPACAGGPRIVTPSAAGCSSLVEAWMKPVEGADLPIGETVGDWIVFGDQQTGKLDTANDRIVNGYVTIARCEARDAAAVSHASKSWLGRLFD